MSVIVKTNRKKWIDAVNEAADVAAYALAEQMVQDAEKYVPFSGGSIQSAGGLRESADIVKGERTGAFYIVYNSVYALYQWYGVRADGSHKVTHYTTPGTGKQWMERAKEKHARQWQEIAQKKFTEALR